MRKFRESELIINPNGSIYHLNLQPEQVAGKVILVGDQGRVPMVSAHFDKIEHKSHNREFVTHTGLYKNQPVTVLSTGIGTDNIDIVLNELDALANIDFRSRTTKDQLTSLEIIRLGTSGAMQKDIPVDTLVASSHGLGFDGLLHFYDYDSRLLATEITEAFVKYTSWNEKLPYPYIVAANDKLLKRIAYDMTSGITATANGFFGPQGRELRIPLAYPDLNQRIESFQFQNHRITNFEMETSALYALGKILGHKTLTVCSIIANRARKEYSADYKKTVEEMIARVLDRFVSED